MTTRNLANLSTRLYGVPLMVLPAVADALSTTFQTLLEQRGGLVDSGDDQLSPVKPHAFAANVRAERYAEKPYVVTDDGVGVLGVYGVLLQRYAFDAASCTSFASYQVIRQRMDAMLADADVKAVLLEVDSPGGEAAGAHDLARALYSAAQSSGKPLWAHVNEDSFSAAYYLTSSARRIVVPQAGRVGSIGTVMAHVDQSRRDEKMGVSWTFVHSGKHKVDGNSHQPLSAQARKYMEAEVARLTDMFVNHVAQARSIDAQDVRNTEAGLLAAGDARQLGLVDAVASFDDTLAELTDLVRSGARNTVSPTTGGRAATTTAKGATMSHTDPAATQAAAPPMQGITEAQAAERESAAYQRGLLAGRAAEAERVKGVRAALLPGHEALVERLAGDGKTTPAEAAAAVIAAEREATAAAAASHRKDAPEAVPTAHAPEGGKASLKGADLGRAAVALFREFTGQKGA
jgi:signal peptide peptidase SppA